MQSEMILYKLKYKIFICILENLGKMDKKRIKYIAGIYKRNWQFDYPCGKLHSLKNYIRMEKRTINIIVILLIAIFLTILSQLNILESSAKFMLIPILTFYYIGQYVERRFHK